jgi:tetratricopeptide (TPR) repeat protein
MHRRALTIRRKVFGTDNAYTAASAANLAEALAAEGMYEESRALIAEALETEQQILGKRAPEVAITLEQYAAILRRTGNIVLAEEMEGRAASIRIERSFTVSVKEIQAR